MENKTDTQTNEGKTLPTTTAVSVGRVMWVMTQYRLMLRL